MAEKTSRRTSGAGVKPVPTKLYASWEVEKTTPNCIPRICSLTASHLTVVKPLEGDLTSVIVAVSVQNSKRVLRSNEILLPTSGLLDTDLEIGFSLQYAHFIKREVNKLQVTLQRRKRYKNRTILGYKTLAVGYIDMTQVLQKSVEMELDLYSDQKEGSSLVAQIRLQSITSQPVDHEENGRQKLVSGESVDRFVENDSDEDEELGMDEYMSNDDISDVEQVMDEEVIVSKRPSRRKMRSPSQRNFKQKLMAILRRFRMADEVLDVEQDDEEDQCQNQRDIDMLMDELEELSDSGQEMDMDTLSIMSTPKPSLRPFFAGTAGSTELLDDITQCAGLLSKQSPRSEYPPYANRLFNKDQTRSEPVVDDTKVDSDSHGDNLTDQELEIMQESNSPPKDEKKIAERPKSPSFKSKVFSRDKDKDKEKPSSSNKDKKSKKEQREARNPFLERENSFGYEFNLPDEKPRKNLIERINSTLPVDDVLPDNVIFVNGNEQNAQFFYQKLVESHQVALCTCTNADVRAALSAVMAKLQKFCNSNAKKPSPIKLVLVGGDNFFNAMLRIYVEQFSVKPPDWQAYIKFLIIPFGPCYLAKYLSSIDNTYQTLFGDPVWRETFDKDNQNFDFIEITNRISRYLSGSSSVLSLPIAEAMISCKGKGNEEESSQVFIPFINEVRVGIGMVEETNGTAGERTTGSTLTEDMDLLPSVLSGSPPTIASEKKDTSPPNSPNIGGGSVALSTSTSSPSFGMVSLAEYIDLQVDYWTVSGKVDAADKDKSKKDGNKNCLKSAFRSIKVTRLPPSGEVTAQTLTMLVSTKEKKPKVMRIGKKKDILPEYKSQTIDSISRLVCTSKSQNLPLKVSIDGVHWNCVRFFQISSQWQTHIKQFPVALFRFCDST